MPTLINFGPDQPQLRDQASAVAAGPRRDGLIVEQELPEVVHALATADGSWPHFTEVGGQRGGEVYVNPANVRFAAHVD